MMQKCGNNILHYRIFGLRKYVHRESDDRKCITIFRLLERSMAALIRRLLEIISGLMYNIMAPFFITAIKFGRIVYYDRLNSR